MICLKKLCGLVLMLMVSSLALASAGDGSNANNAPTRSGDRSTLYFGVGSTSVFTNICDNVAGSCDDTDTTVNYFVGFRANNTWAFEFARLDLGSYNVPVKSVDVTARELSGLYMYPVMDRVTVYGRLGAAAIDSSISNNPDYVSNSVIWGAGAEVAVYAGFSARVDYRRYSNIDSIGGDSFDADLISVSALYTFH